jgi:predicted nucleotidyltransferase
VNGKVDPLTISHVTARLAKSERLSWDALVEQASEVVVFGSRASGLQRRESDLDVLCIGSGKRLKTTRLDVIWKTVEEVESERWLSSELAGHIGAFGLWLRGSGQWKGELRPGSRAIDHKRKRILALVEGLHAHWNRLDPDFHRKYLTVIRHDVQRLECLAAGLPVPPTPLLDKNWMSGSSCFADFERSIRDTDVCGPRLREQISRVADLICQSRLDARAVGQAGIERVLVLNPGGDNPESQR